MFKLPLKLPLFIFNIYYDRRNYGMEYNTIAFQYALTRQPQNYIGLGLMSELPLQTELSVLDFGCGTGNYIKLLSQLTNWKLYGIDASDNMLDYARKRNASSLIKKGTDSKIPFKNNMFDYVYMVDVIHHIDNINQMFKEFSRVSKENSILCICTENETQRKEKFWYQYFPSAFNIDNLRFYSAKQIIKTALDNGYILKSIQENNIIQYHSIPLEFLTEIENKSISVLHLINQNEYNLGLKKIQNDYKKRKFFLHKKGHCFIWLQKTQKK